MKVRKSHVKDRMSLQTATGWRRPKTLSISTPPDEGEIAAWNSPSHSPAILTGSVSFGGELPRLWMVGSAGTGAEGISTQTTI